MFGNNQRQESVVIGDKRFLITSWSVTECIKNLPKIGNAFAVPFSVLMGTLGDTDKLQEAIPIAFMQLFSQMEEQDSTELFKLIIKDASIEGRPADLNADFGDLDELLQVASKCLEINYGCLLKGEGFKNLFGIMSGMTKVAQA